MKLDVPFSFLVCSITMGNDRGRTVNHNLNGIYVESHLNVTLRSHFQKSTCQEYNASHFTVGISAYIP